MTTETIQKISNNIYRLMNENNIKSVVELARKMDCPPTTLHNLLKNKNKNPTIQVLIKIANFFNISVNDLINDNPVMFMHNYKFCPILTKAEIKLFINDKLTPKEIKSHTVLDQVVSNKAFAILTDKKIEDYRENTLLIFDQINPNSVAFPTVLVILSKGKIFIKKVFYIDNEYYVKPESSLTQFFKNKLLTLDDFFQSEIQILGILISVIYNYE